MKPDKEKYLEYYVDTDFCGNWNKLTATDDISTAKSKIGYIIKLLGALNCKHK